MAYGRKTSKKAGTRSRARVSSYSRRSTAGRKSRTASPRRSVSRPQTIRIEVIQAPAKPDVNPALPIVPQQGRVPTKKARL